MTRRMHRFLRYATMAVAATWAIFTFIANTSPKDVGDGANLWLQFWHALYSTTWVYKIVTSPVVFGLSCALGGLVLGWVAKSSWATHPKSNRIPWNESLALDMSLLASNIEHGALSADFNRINAEIDVVRVQAEKHGLPFPRPEKGFNTIHDLLPYLTRVSAHLEVGNFDHARSAASTFSQKK